MKILPTPQQIVILSLRIMRIMRLDELSFVVRLERCTTEDSSSRRIMRLVPVFILENNASNDKYLPKFVQTDNASSSIKTAIDSVCIGFQISYSTETWSFLFSVLYRYMALPFIGFYSPWHMTCVGVASRRQTRVIACKRRLVRVHGRGIKNLFLQCLSSTC